MNNKKCYIYKITSPSGKIYIGETCDIKTRFRYYNNLQCKNQVRLYHSFNKYGVENHEFKIIKECEKNELPIQERYYQLLYNSIGKNGLNCKLTEINNKKYSHSQETKDKISKSNKGKKHSLKTKKLIGKKTKGRIVSKETREKMSKSRKGKSMPKGFGKKVSERMKGNIVSQKTRDKISKIQLGRKLTEEWKKAIQNSSIKKKVYQYDLNNNFIKEWDSTREASRSLKICNGSISKCCNNKVKTAGKYIWKYEK